MKGKKRHTIEDLKRFAISQHGGKCLSNEYTRNDQKYRWKCNDKSHPVFEARWDNVKRGRWCKSCSNNGLRMDFEIIKKKIRDFGGTIITKESEYVNSKSPLKYKCEHNHLCHSDWNRLRRARINKNGKKLNWCSTCSGKKKYTLAEVQKMFKMKNGKLLSTEYINNKQKLTALCSNNHKFEINLHNMLQGQWCRCCNSGYGEEFTRFILEHLFEDKFPKTNPEWLNGLELDGYNKELKIAFEYQGVQHKKYTPVFHQNGLEDFKSQQRRDELKRKKCLSKGVVLIEIDDDTVNKAKLQDYLKQELKKLNIKFKNNSHLSSKAFYNKFYSNDLKPILDIVEKKKGQLLSPKYLGESTPLEFICSKGNVFLKKPSSIKKGIWCLHECCYSKAPASERVKKYIENKGGKLLSKYINRNTPLTFECDKGHITTTTWASLQKGWCSVCSKNKRGTIEEMRSIAKQRKGRCLSKKYLGANVNLEWECKCKHRWKATPSNIKTKGSWCPKCFNEKRSSKAKNNK